MKIAIDVCDLDHQRIDGTRVYIKNVLNKLGEIDQENQYFLYHQKDFNPLLAPKMFGNYVDRKIPYKFWWTQTKLAYEVLQDKPDVLWMPIQQMPYLVKGRIKTVVTIHDLAFKIFPEDFTFGDRFKLNLFADYAVKNTNRIIAVSKSTKKDILRFYPKVDEEKIKVVYHGVDPCFRRNNKKATNYSPALPAGRLPTTNCLLYVGAIQPRKDLVTLVKALEIIRSKGQQDLKLMIVGAPAWKSEESLEYIKNSKYRKDIVLAGQGTFEQLPSLYQNASVFVLPSKYEGFGMPVLEAFASEVPVIVTNNSSLSEVAGDAALKFKTGDYEELAGVLLKLLGDDRLKTELIERGKKRMEEFSWEKCARETLEVLENIKDK